MRTPPRRLCVFGSFVTSQAFALLELHPLCSPFTVRVCQAQSSGQAVLRRVMDEGSSPVIVMFRRQRPCVFASRSGFVVALVCCHLHGPGALAFAPPATCPASASLSTKTCAQSNTKGGNEALGPSLAPLPSSPTPPPSSPASEAPSVSSLRQLRRLSLARRRRAIADEEDSARGREDLTFLVYGAVAPPLLAFAAWERISGALSGYLFDRYGALGADGAARFTDELLRPTITGVVVPVISIALATLVSTTVNVLRSQQVEIRALVNKEACDLRLLRRAIFGKIAVEVDTDRGGNRRNLRCARLCRCCVSFAEPLKTSWYSVILSSMVDGTRQVPHHGLPPHIDSISVKRRMSLGWLSSGRIMFIYSP